LVLGFRLRIKWMQRKKEDKARSKKIEEVEIDEVRKGRELNK